MTVTRLLTLIAIAIVCGPSLVFADFAASVVEIRFGGQVCNQGRCQMASMVGSGVFVGDQNGVPVVATVWHGAKTTWPNPHSDATQDGRATKPGHYCHVIVNRQRYEGRLIGWDVRQDTTLIAVDMPMDVVQISSIDEREQIPVTETAEMIGFPDGKFTRVRSHIVRRFRDANRGSIELAFGRGTTQGQSGGGVFSSRGLAGIVHTTISRECYSTPGDHLAGMCRHYKVRIRCRGRIESQPPQPQVVPPPPIPAGPIEPPYPVPPSQPGEQGPIGPQGPPGSPGVAGPAGRDGIDGKDGRDGKDGVDGKQGPTGPRGEPGPPGTVTVILIDDTGAEIKRVENVQSGSVVRLNVKKILQKE